MNTTQQVQILTALTQLMHDSANGNYEEICCEFEYEVYDGGWSVGSQFSFVRGGLTFSTFLDDPEDKASGYVNELHELMMSQTGGDWKRFVLVIDSNGRANTKFSY